MSIVLNGTAESLKVVLDATPVTNQCTPTVNYALQGGAAGDATVTTNGTTAVSLVAGSASGAIVVNSIQFRNADTAQRTLTVQKANSAGTYVLYQATLSAGAALMYDGDGWYCLDQYGNLLSASGLPAGVTITTPNVTGVTNGGNATTGSVGEYQTVSNTSGTNITSAQANITSLSLTAGDWDVWGAAVLLSSSGNNLANGAAGLSTTSATLGASGTYFQIQGPGQNTIADAVPLVRLSISATTTIYLVGYGGIVAGSGVTVSATGSISARRVR